MWSYQSQKQKQNKKVPTPFVKNEIHIYTNEPCIPRSILKHELRGAAEARAEERVNHEGPDCATFCMRL